ncbi:MAG: DUF5667 domain-containing protein [Patescibacteria group bacterium]
MEDKALINKLKELRKIEPSHDWVISTKTMILGEAPRTGWISNFGFFPNFVFRYNKAIFATLIVFGFVAGAFTFSQNSLPGDPFYVFKKITESSRMAFADEKDLPKLQLELVNQRLEELDRIAKGNRPQNLASAIQEFQANMSKAAENMIKVQDSDVNEIVSETKKIEENKERIESLGIVIGETTDLDSALLQLIDREIKDLEVRTLSDSQKEIFTQAVDAFKTGNYSDALEKILLLSNQQ